MTIENYTPTGVLRPYIKIYKIIESDRNLQNRVLPGTSLSLSFRFKGENSYSFENGQLILPKFGLSGLRKSARLINYKKDTSTLIVLFKECGASAFFKEPLHELFESSISLGNIFSSNELNNVEERLSMTQTNLQRVLVIEQFLIGKLIKPKADELILKAISRIHTAKGDIRIRELADRLFTSTDAFEKRFRKIVGSSPKQYCFIVRLSSIIQNKPEVSELFDLAYDAGFYDQAHFNKDFKHFTGLPPLKFFESTPFW